MHHVLHNYAQAQKHPIFEINQFMINHLKLYSEYSLASRHQSCQDLSPRIVSIYGNWVNTCMRPKEMNLLTARSLQAGMLSTSCGDVDTIASLNAFMCRLGQHVLLLQKMTAIADYSSRLFSITWQCLADTQCTFSRLMINIPGLAWNLHLNPWFMLEPRSPVRYRSLGTDS